MTDKLNQFELVAQIASEDFLKSKGYSWKTCVRCSGMGHEIITDRMIMCAECCGEGGRWNKKSEQMRIII